MAFATEPVAEVTIGLVDASSTRSTVRAFLPSTTLAATALADGVTLAGLIAALTDCQVETVSVTYKSADAAAPVATWPGARVEDKGQFSFIAANGKFSKLAVPAIKRAKVDQSGAIPTGDTDVAALITEMTGGTWVSSTGSLLANIHAAYERFRGSTRHMLPTDRLVA